eukprot:jgi/Undpi1/4194/HiC_scaffold_16.g07561.m1
MAVGMGQMETKVFPASFPDDFEARVETLLRIYHNRTDQAVDEAIKKALLDTCNVNADKVLNSVSWAKFGERSTLDFKWNCIKEKIAAVEGIEPRDVSTLLRNEADIVLLEKK